MPQIQTNDIQDGAVTDAKLAVVKADSSITQYPHAGSYTLTSTDLSNFNSGRTPVIVGDGSGDLTVPNNSAVAFPVGTLIGVRAYNNVVQGSGVTITGTRGDLSIPSTPLGATAVLEKTAANTWILNNGQSGSSGAGTYYGASSGTNTYAVALTPTLSALASGVSIDVKFGNASNGASTLNPDSLGAKKIFKTPTVQAGNGDIPANATINLVYDAALDSAAGGWLMVGSGPVAAAHIAASAAAHAATAISFSPGGNFSSTTVQAAIEEAYNDAVAAAGVAGSTLDLGNGGARPTAAYTLVLGDAGKIIETDVATAHNITIPQNSSVAFPTRTMILFGQYGAGQITINPDTGVTLRSVGGRLKTFGQYSQGYMVKVNTNEWWVNGDLTL